MADAAYVESAVESAPKDYTIAASQELRVKAVRAVVNGQAATGAYLPAVQLIAPSGAVMWTAVPPEAVAAGASADVSWFPGGGVETQTGTPSGASGPAGGDLLGRYPNPTVADVSILTAKGDLLSRGLTAPAQRVPVGADGLFLQADSLQALGLKWAAAGGAGAVEYDYVENTAGPFNITATTEGTSQTYIGGNAVTYDGATRVKVEFWCALAAANGGTGVASLFMDGATLGWIVEWSTNSGTQNYPVYGVRYLTPAAGAHTFNIQVWKTAGTFSLTGKPAATKQELPAFYRVTKA